MSFDAAVTREQGVTFVVVCVQRSAIDSASSREDAAAAFCQKFPGMPVVLMAQDGSGRPTFWGRPDIVRFLSRVPVRALPWKRWS